MLITRDQHKLYTLDRIWFNAQIETDGDIYRYTRITEKKPDNWYSIHERSYTVINDLTFSNDDILKAISRTTKYHIRRAKKEGVSIDCYYGKNLTIDSTALCDFKEAYRQCAKSIDDYDLMSAYSERKIKNFVENECALLSIARYDSICVFHFYVFDNNDAVLLYSVSNFREEREKEYIAGMANKLLHYEDMVLFKTLGLTSYDWGNISSNTDLNGIDTFKLSFGGKIEERYNSFVGHTCKGKVLVWAKKKLKKHTRMNKMIK